MTTTVDESPVFSLDAQLDEMLNVPDVVFIVPYRNREQHKTFFTRYMTDYILKDVKYKWRIVFVHQCDVRAFNRGAMKNLGFKYLKDKYPKYYKDITIVFNDVDTLPYKEGLIDYTVAHGNVKHFYGYNFALGGIFSIKAGDFEIINGFPNLWGWGFEDNEIQNRWVDEYGKNTIDRTSFYNMYDHNILSFFNGNQKVVSHKQKDEYGDTFVLNRNKKKNVRFLNGLNTLYNVVYEEEPIENSIAMVKVIAFDTTNDDKKYSFQVQNIQTSSFKYVPKRGSKIKMVSNTRR
jgi:hypothetical protein